MPNFDQPKVNPNETPEQAADRLSKGLELTPLEGEVTQTAAMPDDVVQQTAPVKLMEKPAMETGVENKVQGPDSWTPGEYEVALSGGKSIEGIPSSANVDIYMGKTDDEYTPRTKHIWLSYKEGKSLIQETRESHASAGVTNIQFTGNKIEIHEGETVIMGREFNDEREPSEHFDITDEHDKKVSRKHVSISLVNGTYSIKDLDSTNGSFVKITVSRPSRPPEPKEEPLPKIRL